MNMMDLWFGHDANNEATYFWDKELKRPYTGHVEDYFHGVLNNEFDVKNGYKNGIEKVYYDYTGELEAIQEVKDNLVDGLSIEYYKSGKIQSIEITIDNLGIDSYVYDEDGNVVEKKKAEEDNIHYLCVRKRILQYREKYDLDKMNEEILKYGKPIHSGTPIY